MRLVAQTLGRSLPLVDGWVYLYAAAELGTNRNTALLAPNMNSGTFHVFLQMLAAELRPTEHTVLLRAPYSRQLNLDGDALALPAIAPPKQP